MNHAPGNAPPGNDLGHAAPPLDLADPVAVARTLRAAAGLFRDCPMRRGNVVHLPAEGHVTVTGDLHDHSLNFRRILKLAALDQPSLLDPLAIVGGPSTNASGSGGGSTSGGGGGGQRHLILHEVIHGTDRLNDADLSIRTLLRCADLKCRHPSQVHVVLSNHELAQLRGEGITKEGVSVVEAFDEGINFLYGDAADDVRDAMNDYIKALPLAVKLPRGIMVAHSLPAPRRIEAFDPTILDREVTEQDRSPHGSAYDMVWGRYQNERITEELAEAWGVSAFVLGHQPAEMGYSLLARNSLIIASDHSHGVALSIDLSRAYRRDDLVHAVRSLNSVMV